MRSLGKKCDRMQELCDFGVGVAMAEDRQTEGRLSDEHVAWHALERRAGRIFDVLVIAGRDDAQPARFDRHLRRAEHVARGMKGQLGATDVDALPITDRLGRAGEILAETQPHDIEGFPGGEDGTVPCVRVVGVAVRDHCLIDGTGRIDMEITELAAHAARRRQHDILRSH